LSIAEREQSQDRDSGINYTNYTNMAKEKEQMTMEEYLLSQLETPVKLKDGTVATKEDGSVMTKQEAIATNILNQAMNRRSSESRAKRLAA
jgi:acyl CoA:acetate/3-ketoacid CoA transferase